MTKMGWKLTQKANRRRDYKPKKCKVDKEIKKKVKPKKQMQDEHSTPTQTNHFPQISKA